MKVLDFGLAKAASADAVTADLTQSPTLTVGGTKEGVILGTATYMSPEQARGRPADKRADVWAFGVVLYEMLTGRRAFEGEVISEVLARVIEREPDWTTLPASTPARLRELLRRCLRKDPKTRLQAIGDARVQIDELISGATEETAAVVATQPRAQRGARLAWIVAALSLVIAAALAVPATRYFSRAVPEPDPTRFEIPTPPTSDPVSFALSADGRQLAFVATAEGVPRLWVRPLDQVTARPLAGTEGARYPFWKPDGRAIGFFADGKLKWIDLGSDVLHEPADAPNGRGGTWNRDGVIVFAPAGGGVLMRVMATGGTPVPVTTASVTAKAEPSLSAVSPRWAPFPLFRWDRPPETSRACTWGRSTAASRHAYSRQDRRPCTRRPASLLWVQQGVLVAQRFDPARAVVSGEPIPVVQDVGLDEAVYRGAFAVSATGVLAHRTGRGERRQLTWVDRAGVARGTVGPPDETGLSGPELAPDGQRVAVHRTVEANTDVWLIDTGRDVSTRFTFDSGLDTDPLWSSDGTRVVFSHRATACGTCSRKRQVALATIDRCWHRRNLRWRWAGRQMGNGCSTVLAIRRQGWTSGPRRWLATASRSRSYRPRSTKRRGNSPPTGGGWRISRTNPSPVQIYIRPFPGPGGPRQVTTAGGSQPRWRPDGKELFYVGLDGRLMAVPIAVGADRQLEAGTAVALFRTRLATGANINSGTRIEGAVRSRLRRRAF